MNWLIKHRDWWLPVFTTFLGVFAAVSASLYFESLDERKRTQQLLDVALDDVCISFAASSFALEAELDPNVGLPNNIPIPELALSLLTDNATIFADFHPTIALELTRLIADLQITGIGYNAVMQQAGDVKQFARAPMLDSNGTEFAKLEVVRLNTEALAMLKDYDDALAWTSHMLNTEKAILAKNLTKQQAEDALNAETYDVPCE